MDNNLTTEKALSLMPECEKLHRLGSLDADSPLCQYTAELLGDPTRILDLTLVACNIYRHLALCYLVEYVGTK